MQDARGLVRTPVGIDVGAVIEQELGDFEVTVDDRPGKSSIENALLGGYASRVTTRRRAVAGEMIGEVPQHGLA